MEVLFEGETVNIFYRNGIVVPKDFEAYELNLWKLVRYVSKVIQKPLEANPSEGLWEIAGLKDDILFSIEGIDRYFSEGGRYHKKALKNIRDHLDGRLYMLNGPITKLGNLLKKG